MKRSTNSCGDRFDDVDALGGGADLSVVEEARPRRARHRDVEVGVFEDDQRIDAAQFQVDALQLLRRADRDPRPDGRRSRERDARHVRVVDERRPGLRSRAGDHVDDAGRQMGQGRLDEPQRRQRRQLRGLDDHGVAGGERRRNLPDEQQQRVVERHDRRHDAERLLDREVDLMFGRRRDGRAIRAAGELRVVLKARGAPLHFVEVLDPRLAAFAREQLREARAVAAHQSRGFVQHLAALERRQPLPVLLRRGRRGARAPHVVGRGIDDLVDELERRRILDAARAAALRILPAAIDPQSAHEVCLSPMPSEVTDCDQIRDALRRSIWLVRPSDHRAARIRLRDSCVDRIRGRSEASCRRVARTFGVPLLRGDAEDGVCLGAELRDVRDRLDLVQATRDFAKERHRGHELQHVDLRAHQVVERGRRPTLAGARRRRS